MPTSRSSARLAAARLLLCAGVVALCAESAAAKSRTLEWEDGACGYEMRYDDAKIDTKTLENTVEILKSQSTAVPSAPFIASPSQIADLDVGKFEADCEASIAAVRDVKLLDAPEIEDYRRGRIELIEDACKFGAIYMKGLKDPAALRSYAPAVEACGAYIDALEGKTDLAAMWRQVGAEQCEDAGDLEKSCKATFEKTGRIGPGDSGMRLTVGMFGWNNCATRRTRFNGDDAEKFEEMGRRVYDAFLARYKVKGNCVSN